MYILRILKIAVLIAAAVSICSCDKKPTVRETVKEQPTQKVKTKKKKVKKAKTEQTKTADSNEPQWDKRFLSFAIQLPWNVPNLYPHSNYHLRHLPTSDIPEQLKLELSDYLYYKSP